MRRKEKGSKQGQTNNKAKQHSTLKAITFPELPRAAGGTLDTLDSRQSAHVHVTALSNLEYINPWYQRCVCCTALMRPN